METEKIVKEVVNEVHKCKFDITDEAIYSYMAERYNECEDFMDIVQGVFDTLEEERENRREYENDVRCVEIESWGE